MGFSKVRSIFCFVNEVKHLRADFNSTIMGFSKFRSNFLLLLVLLIFTSSLINTEDAGGSPDRQSVQFPLPNSGVLWFIYSAACKGCELLYYHKRRVSVVLYFLLEATSFLLDQFGKRRLCVLLAAFLLSAVIFTAVAYTNINARFSSTTMSQAERQLGIVEVVFSVLQLIVTLFDFIVRFLSVKTHYKIPSLFPLASAAIAVFYIFKSDDNPSAPSRDSGTSSHIQTDASETTVTPYILIINYLLHRLFQQHQIVSNRRRPSSRDSLLDVNTQISDSASSTHIELFATETTWTPSDHDINLEDEYHSSYSQEDLLNANTSSSDSVSSASSNVGMIPLAIPLLSLLSNLFQWFKIISSVFVFKKNENIRLSSIEAPLNANTRSSDSVSSMHIEVGTNRDIADAV